MHISHTKFFNIPVSIALATLAHMINVYERCLNTINYPIFNMHRFQILHVDLHFGLFWLAGIPTMVPSHFVISLYSQTHCLWSREWLVMVSWCGEWPT